MRHYLLTIAALILLPEMFIDSLNAQVSGSADIPRIISYQGQITTTNGIAMNGTHTITATLYSDPHGTNSVWQGVYSPIITNGIFTVQLGSGSQKLPDNSIMNQRLWVGIKCDEGEIMQPLTALESAPYALNVPDQSITFAKLAPEVVLGMGVGHTPTIQGTSWTQTGDAYNGNLGDILGTKGIGAGQLKMVVEGTTIMRYDATASTPNITGGDAINSITASVGSTIAGGGNSTIGGGPITIRKSDYSIIAGGANNYIDTSNYSFIGGGWDNEIHGKSDFATVGGGSDAEIGRNDTCAFVGGGRAVAIADNSPFSAMVGGKNNFIRILTHHGFLGGGQDNLLDTATSYSAIVGGINNHIFPNNEKSFIGSGYSNFVKSQLSSIAGGDTNLVDLNSDHSFIGGGHRNIIYNTYDVIVGGDSNTVYTKYGAIVGGKQNYVGDIERSFGFIGGGFHNTARGDYNGIVGGTNNLINQASSTNRDFIGGGTSNTIDAGGLNPSDNNSAIAGGISNLIKSDASFIGAGESITIKTTSDHSAIGGGLINSIDTTAPYSFIGGGRYNKVQGSSFSVITGGDTNFVHPGSNYSMIGGGQFNAIDGLGPHNVIGGGHCSWIFSNGIASQDNSILGGFQNRIWGSNYATIGAGYVNKINNGADYSFIGGGDTNIISVNAFLSTIGGGLNNMISSERSAITGGCFHIIDMHSQFSFIGAGCTNYIYDTLATIGGGAHNTILAYSGFIGGGGYNLIDANGGLTHADDNESKYGMIGGGEYNNITKIPLSAISATPPGSLPNGYLFPLFATLGGGYQDSACGHFSAIGGGYQNAAYGFASTIPGGVQLRAGDWQTVTGLFNTEFKSIHNTGALGLITLPNETDPIFIIGNGIGNAANLRSNAFEVAYKGYSFVTGPNGDSYFTLFPLNAPNAFVGGTYRDNTILAWADADGVTVDVNGNLTVVSAFGVTKIHRQAAGIYIVTLAVSDPVTNSVYNPGHISVQVNIVDNTAPTSASMVCGYANASQIGVPAAGQFVIRTYDHTSTGCTTTDKPFMFTLTGR